MEIRLLRQKLENGRDIALPVALVAVAVPTAAIDGSADVDSA